MNKGLSQVSIRLVQESPLLSDESINTPEQAVKVLGEWLEGMDRELVCVLNLQADLKPINMNIVSMGALNESQVHPRTNSFIPSVIRRTMIYQSLLISVISIN